MRRSDSYNWDRREIGVDSIDVISADFNDLDDNDPPSITHALRRSISKYADNESIEYEMYPGAERAVYDFTAERYYLHGTNLIEATSHLVKGCLGVGIMSIHVGFMHAGIWTALAATVVTGLFMCNSMMMLVRSAHKLYVKLRIPKMTYPDLMEASVAVGPWKSFRKCSKVMRHIVDVFLLVKMCGACCIYEIIIARTLIRILESLSVKFNLDIRYIIMIISIPLFIICLIRSLKYLAPFSLIADFIVACCVVSTIYYSLMANENIRNRPAWKSVQGLFRFHGICLYSLDGVAITLPVENSMKKPKYFHIVLQYGMSIVILCSASIGFFGYWGWGEGCKSPLTLHMPINIYSIILHFLLILMLTVSFAVSMWVPFKVLWFYIRNLHKRRFGIWERLYKVLHVMIITGVSVAFPSMNKMVIFYGNFCTAFLAFVFPAIIELFVRWHRVRTIKKCWLLFKNTFLIIFGLVLSADVVFAMNVNDVE